MRSLDPNNPEILKNDAIIEASAGTGKTYSIVEITSLILLQRPDIKLSNILIVTFTEKATTELRDRIRLKLEELLKKDRNRENIRASLNEFDQSAIYTIHGFCNSLLRKYAFENYLSFDLELSDDYIYETLFTDIIRFVWPVRYKRLFDELPGFIQEFYQIYMKDENLIISLARKIEFASNPPDRIMPDYIYKELIKYKEGDLTQNEDIFEIYLSIIKVLFNHIVSYAKEFLKMEKKGLSIEIIFNSMLISKQRSNAYLYKEAIKNKIFAPILELAKKDVISFSDINIYNFIKIYIEDIYKIKWKKIRNGASFSSGFSKYFALASNLNEPFTSIYNAFLKTLDRLASLENSINFKTMFLIDNIYLLKSAVNDYKKESIEISYSDMIYHVRNTLYSNEKEGGIFLNELRKQYKYAIIDEFQDTDRLQWDIFSKIFQAGEVKNSNAPRIFLIGDPKQGIYGFRKADLFIYNQAKDRIQQKYTLNKNYRTLPSLQHNLNILFSSSKWGWLNGEDIYNIIYTPVSSPDDKEKIRYSLDKESALNQNHLIVFDYNTNTKDSSLSSSDFFSTQALLIANEIKYLLENKQKHRLKVNGKDKDYRDLEPGDIAILFANRKGISELREELSKVRLRGVSLPFSIYKSGNLFDSKEAVSIYLVLSAIIKNDPLLIRAALSTDFFDLPFDMSELSTYELQLYEDFFYRWRIYLTNGKLSLLFHSMLNETGLKYRIFLDNERERRLTNYKHIFEKLLTYISENGYNIEGLLRYIRDKINESNEDLVRSETDRKKISLLTMHSAKGLQFPIVFIYSGSSFNYHLKYKEYHQPYKPSNLNNRDDALQQKIFDLNALNGSIGYNKWKEEEKEAAKRLFYVALTRAGCRLYIPRYFKKNSRSKDICDFLYETLTEIKKRRNTRIKFIDAEKIKKELLIKNSTYTPHPFKQNHYPLSIVKDEQKKFIKKYFIEGSIDQSYADKSIIQHYSYSSLSRHRQRDILLRFDENGRPISLAIEDEATIEEEDEENFLKGSEFGSFIHSILELIDYKDYRNKQAKSILYSTEPSDSLEIIREKFSYFLKLKGIYNSISLKRINDSLLFIIEKIINTLNTSIFVNKEFVLADLKDNEMVRETDFNMPFKSFFEFLKEHKKSKYFDDLDIEELSEKIFISGQTDIIFKVDGKYYFADWKSDILRPEFLSNKALYKYVNDHYGIQYKLYTLVVLKWLSKTIQGFKIENFNKYFGGFFYFFIRYMDNEKGFFFMPTDRIDVYRYSEYICSLLIKKIEKKDKWII